MFIIVATTTAVEKFVGFSLEDLSLCWIQGTAVQIQPVPCLTANTGVENLAGYFSENFCRKGGTRNEDRLYEMTLLDENTMNVLIMLNKYNIIGANFFRFEIHTSLSSGVDATNLFMTQTCCEIRDILAKPPFSPCFGIRKTTG